MNEEPAPKEPVLEELAPLEPWRSLRAWTTARLALGRAGGSTPTQAVLDFQLDHALARDAITATLNVERLQTELQAAGFTTLLVTSDAEDRRTYLRRPDLGRRLAAASRTALLRPDAAPAQTLTIVVADGLAALAANTHAVPLLLELRARLAAWQLSAPHLTAPHLAAPHAAAWTLDSIVLATQARVALGDGIAMARGAEAVLVLIGERPGLRAHDSLGAYLTYRPHAAHLDAERNCVSNIRAEGLPYAAAAEQIAALLEGARRLGTTGVQLKLDATPALVDGVA